MKKDHNRKCILHLSAPLDNFYSAEFWKGASEEASFLGYDFVSVSGGLEVSWLNGIHIAQNMNETRSTLMYQLPEKSLFDGVVLWGGQMKHDADDGAIQALVNYFAPLPIVSLGWEGNGVYGLKISNYDSMKELIRHVIINHGHTKIAYLRNDREQEAFEFAERCRAYKEALKQQDISYNENLVVDGHAVQKISEQLSIPATPHDWGALAIKELIDNRNLIPGIDFTAVAARDDKSALSAISELRERGFKVPEDIAVTGFDNIIESRCSFPPLSTVSQSFREQGALSVRKLDAILSNKPDTHTDSNTMRVIIRESCGCTNRFAKSILEVHQPKETAGIPQSLRNTGLEQLSSLSTFGRRSSDISHSLDKVAKTFSSAGEDPMEIVSLVEELALNGSINQTTRAAANILTGDIAQRLQLMGKIKAEKRRETLDAIDQNIFASYDMNIILPSIEIELPALGARSCWIVLYEDPFRPDKNGKMLFSYINGTHIDLAGKEKQLFPVSSILPDELWPDDSSPYSLLIQSLHFGNRRIGYVILQDDGSDGRSFSSLALRLSGALEGSFLVNDLNKKRDELEKAYEEILALSNHDSLTHLSNRRNFERELFAEHRRMIRHENPDEYRYAVLFIDLDNFKYYNDTFGHDVGDAALIAFARFLPTCVRITDIVARYGGDEFICLLPETQMQGTITVAQRILSKLIEIGNLLAETQSISGMKLEIPPEKLLNCSIGIAVQDGTLTADEVIKTADDGLYLAKKSGKACWKTTQH